MTKMTKKELILTTKPRYLKADKKEKGKILDEFCSNTKYDRNYAIQIFQAKYEYDKITKEGRKPRKKIYSNEVILKAIKVWELLDFPCGARLKPMLKSTLEAMINFGEISVSKETMASLEKISAKTLDRRLAKERETRHLNKNRGTTRHGNLLKSSIPIRITNWDTNELGFMEMDTVAHNGGDVNGEFIYSLDMVEICSDWSEQYAVIGKGEAGVIKAVDEIKNGLSFNLTGLDSDGGSEFINWHMVEYCKKNNLFFTRSRPDRKNDNAYVEQKNNTHIRHLLGYGRFDKIEQLIAINALYRQELRLFNNFFKPVMKIVSKEKINNSVCRKKYDTAKTPYQRLMEHSKVSGEKKKELKALYLFLNPAELKRKIDKKTKEILKLQSLTN